MSICRKFTVPIVKEEILQGRCNIVCPGFYHISYLAVGHNFRESANIGYQHWFFKMISYLSNSALSGGLIGLHHYIRCTEIICHILISNKVGSKYESLFNSKSGNLLSICFWVGIEFTRNN